MYYIIETNYVGPNRAEGRYLDSDTIEIRYTPAITNSSREERTEGWCGTTNDWAVYAHGEHATIEEARAAIAQKFGEVRDSDANGDRFESDDENVIETYKPGKYAPMSSEATAEWACSEIEADTTDDRIVELVAEYEAEANSSGYTLGSDLEGFMLKRRQELRDELENEAL